MKLKKYGIGLIILMVIVFCSCSQDQTPQDQVAQSTQVSKKILKKKYNILILTVDTLRSDYVSFNNSALKIRTDNIDKLAAKGVAFTQAHSQSSWTLPSLVTLFTSLYPPVHHAGEPVSTGEIAKVPRGLKELSLILKDNSYTTAAFITNVFLSSAFWFGNNFETFINYSNQIDASEKITQNAIQFFKHKRDKPFLLWLHYLDPHEYHTYVKGDIDKGYRGRFASEELDWDKLKTGAYRLDRYERDYVRSRYMKNIKYFDGQVGAVLSALKQQNLYENTLVIFTSDHGEEFWEHGRLDHGQTAYEEVLHVPLILSLPGVLPSGLKVSQLAGLVDIVPTVLDLCEISSDVLFQGSTLLPCILNPDFGHDRFLFTSGTLYGENKISVQNSKFKLVYCTVSDLYELYDLKNDPLEHKNIYSSDDELAVKLKLRLNKWIKENSQLSEKIMKDEKVTPAVIDKDTKESLKSLGYIM